MAWYKREDRDDDLSEEKRSVPAGVFTKCPGCRAALLTADLEKNDNVCPQCEHHFPLSSARRVELILDPGSFVEADGSIESVDPLGFRDSKKLRRPAAGGPADRRAAPTPCAPARGGIEGRPVEVGVFVFEFMGGSMGSVVGEKLTRTLRAGARAQGAGAHLFGLGRGPDAGGRPLAHADGQDLRRARPAARGRTALPFDPASPRPPAAWPPASPCWGTSSWPSRRR